MSDQKNFLGTQKRVRINHGKCATGIRVTEVLLYMLGFSHPLVHATVVQVHDLPLGLMSNRPKMDHEVQVEVKY